MVCRLGGQIGQAYNSTYNKLAVQWLNEPLCLVSGSVLADSFVLRKRQLLVAANRLWCILKDDIVDEYESHQSLTLIVLVNQFKADNFALTFSTVIKESEDNILSTI